MRVNFLSIDEVVAIHRDQIERYGGDPGVRDVGLLLSAVSMPQAAFEGELLHPNLYDMAAAYLFHIVSNHPFIDGNKRTGAVAAIVFLEVNGIELKPDEKGVERITKSVADGSAMKKDLSDFLRSISATT